MEHIEEIASKNRERAWKVIEDTGIINMWESANMEINLVGSLKTGLLVKHRDIDFHIYSGKIEVADDFSIMGRLAESKRIRRVEYGNMLDTEERCLEWHAWYEDDYNELWQIDMIHIIRGSRYDGYFEKVAERISSVLTDETRQAIMRLKYETPESEKIMGIEYYQAVIRDGIRTYSGFLRWRERQPVQGVIEWIP